MNPYICVQVDWDDDGAYTSTDENISALIRNKQGLMAFRGNDQLQDLSPPMSGSFNLTVDNQDQLFSVENIASALYGLLVPGHLTRVKIDTLTPIWNVTNAANSLWSDISSAPASYVIQTGDVLTYDIKWVTAADKSAFDLEDGAGFRLDGKGAKDQNGLSADAGTDISAYALYNYYTRKIVMPATIVGKTITKFSVGIRNSFVGAPTSSYQNIFILSTDGTVTPIMQFSDVAITAVALHASNATLTSTGLSHSYLWTGYLDNIKQNSSLSEVSATLPALGTLSRLVGNTVTTQLYSNITTDVALGHLCDAAGIDASLRNFQTGDTTLEWWWLDNEDAFQAATTLLYTEGPGAKLYEDGQGRIVFENRQYRYTNANSITSQWSLVTTGTVDTAAFKTYTYDPGLKNIINQAIAVQKSRSEAGSLSVVWSYGTGTITLAANEVWSVQTNVTDPFMAGVVPVVVTDYTLISGAVTPTISADNGTSITITMTAGVAGCSFSGLQFRAKTVAVDNSVVIYNTVDTTSSQTTYGLRPYTLPLRSEISVNTMQDLVNGIAATYSQPRATITFGIMAADGGRKFSLIKALDVSHRVTVTEAQSAFAGDVWIESVSHSMLTGVNFTSTYGAEKIIDTLFGIWGSAIWDSAVWGF